MDCPQVSCPALVKFDYDALGRLTAFKDGLTDVAIESYAYDATGNRQSFTNAVGTQAYTYPSTSHRLSQVGAVARTYDNAGNTTAIGGTAKEFVYDDTGRMSQVMQNAIVQRNYAYNGKGEQVRKYLGTSNTYTIYDEAGHWLGDYDSTGAALQQAIWLDDLPVGLIANGNQLHYIEPDHLGTPRVVIEVVRNVPVWKWDLRSEVFGNGVQDQDPDGDANPFVFNMRFPGQRYDAASGLNYNYFRDGYEPPTGRYSQPDPIGFRGGISMYAYVDGDPINWVDPLGLQRFGPGPRINRPGGGNAHQRAIWNSAQLRAIQNNTHTTPIYTRGLTPEQISSRENLANIATGNDYTQYCAVAICRQNANQCTQEDTVSSWIPAIPTVAQVNAMGCSCAQPFYSGTSPVKEPSANAFDIMQLISDFLGRR